MNKFEDELKNGNFVISICEKCEKTIWPPNDICSNCFSNVIWTNVSGNGKLKEFSTTNEKTFGIVELDEKIKIIAQLENDNKIPEIGQSVRLKKCSYEDGNYVFIFNLI